MRDQTTRLQSRFGAVDKRRLDGHLTGISELRQQILALDAGSVGGSVSAPSCTGGRPATSTNKDVGGAEPFDESNKAFADLLALAWVCDLNRVASYTFFIGNGFTVFSNLGQKSDVHSITHEGDDLAVHNAVVDSMKQFAYLLGALQKTPEGSGNVLDNSCILCVTDCSYGSSYTTADMPILVAGKAGGALKYPGVHFRANGTNTSNVLLTCLQAVGTGITSVGKAQGLSSTVVNEILA